MRRPIALLLLIASPAASPASDDRATREIGGDAFFVERHLPDGTVARSSAHHVPYEVGSACYGWHLHLAPSAGIRVIRERLVLPEPAAQWHSDRDTQIDASGAVGTSEVIVDPATGEAENSWCIAAGDPRGTYFFELFDGDRLIRRLRFTVGLDEV